ncbi:hypothetical protein EYF80_012043 [Liparis tanakae]|uniref:Uncharacterized protein n=1 Tax=Liparis tanakae TaxID=230148 RepID=A0A4Z2IIZ9_9TELE|nr:hypothetical protein EYF80_012043 [Liparis tanakae]
MVPTQRRGEEEETRETYRFPRASFPPSGFHPDRVFRLRVERAQCGPEPMSSLRSGEQGRLRASGQTLTLEEGRSGNLH